MISVMKANPKSLLLLARWRTLGRARSGRGVQPFRNGRKDRFEAGKIELGIWARLIVLARKRRWFPRIRLRIGRDPADRRNCRTSARSRRAVLGLRLRGRRAVYISKNDRQAIFSASDYDNFEFGDCASASVASIPRQRRYESEIPGPIVR